MEAQGKQHKRENLNRERGRLRGAPRDMVESKLLHKLLWLDHPVGRGDGQEAQRAGTSTGFTGSHKPRCLRPGSRGQGVTDAGGGEGAAWSFLPRSGDCCRCFRPGRMGFPPAGPQVSTGTLNLSLAHSRRSAFNGGTVSPAPAPFSLATGRRSSDTSVGGSPWTA